MTDTSASPSKASPKSILAQAKEIASRSQSSVPSQQATKGSAGPLINTNDYAKIMLNPELGPEEKKGLMVQELTFAPDASPAENRQKLEKFAEFLDYLQGQRKALNREGISLQDTEAFVELQSVIDEMTKASLQFQDRIQPLLEVLSAVFEIRKQNKIFEVYREIEADKAWEVEAKRKLESLSESLRAKKEKLRMLHLTAAELQQERSFFGLGGIKKSAQRRLIEVETVEKQALADGIESLKQDIESQIATIAEGPPTSNPELREQKKVLRQFLSLTRDENRAKQKELIESALNFVDTSDVRLKSVIGTLERLGKHAEVMSDANSMLRSMHVVIDEALKDAMSTNKGLKEHLGQTQADESSIARMSREEKLNSLNDHMTLTDQCGVDIANSLGGLTKHLVQIQSYKDTIRGESATTRRLHLEGVSQMGEQLMSVLSAISAAATSESRSVAANNFARMAEQNQVIVSQEVVRNATAIELEANSISKLVAELEDYGELLNVSSDISNQGYSRMRETVGAIRKVSESVHEAIKDLVGDRADAEMGTSAGSEQGPETPKSDHAFDGPLEPFGKLRGSS